MAKKEIMITVNYAKDTPITLEELGEIFNLPSEFINELIAYEIIHPQRSAASGLLFDLQEISRLKRALRLQRDLELNLTGVAIVLDLLEEVQELRAHANLLEKHILR